MSCVFCTDAASAGEIVFEDEHALVLVHPDLAVRGHLMIVSRRHVENPSGLGPEEWIAFARLWQRVEALLLELTGRERSIAMKLGVATPHLHVHLYPFPAAATREEVFAAIDGRTAVEPDAGLVADLRRLLAAT